MDNRKRQRLDLPTNNGQQFLVEDGEATTINMNNFNSLIFRNNQVIDASGLDIGSALPTNLFLTICDDNSSESTDFLTINNTNNLRSIKQEDESNEILFNDTSDTQLQYRLINSNYQKPSHQIVNCENKNQQNNNHHALAVRNLCADKLNAGSASTTTTTVQLPSGCEIYVIKEFVEPNVNSNNNTKTTLNLSNNLLISNAAVNNTSPGSSVRSNPLVKAIVNPKATAQTQTQSQSQFPTVTTPTLPPTTTIKIEPDLARRLAVNESNLINVQTIQNTVSSNSNNNTNTNNSINVNKGNVLSSILPGIQVQQKSMKHSAASTTTCSFAKTFNNPLDSNIKKACTLEAYKKRDDKRRATHNEVERRRRDKINSWIFKLKEMLPSSSSTNGNKSSSSNDVAVLNGHSNAASDQFHRNVATNNSRTPPNDSKSQILIKACEYIKGMQDEIKSLRECLMENEKLRSNNQRLQNELNQLKTECQYNKIKNNNISNKNNNNYNFYIKDDIIANMSSNNNDFDDDLDDDNISDTHHHHHLHSHEDHLMDDNNHDMDDDDDDQLFNELNDTTTAHIEGEAIIAQKFPILTTTTAATTTTSPIAIIGKTSLVSLPITTTYTKRELIIRDYVD